MKHLLALILRTNRRLTQRGDIRVTQRGDIRIYR